MTEESNPRTDRLLRLAESLTEGADVDWDSETGLDLLSAGTVAGLRDLAAVIAAHRGLSLPQASPPEPARKSAAPGTWGPLRLERKVGQGLSGEVHAAVHGDEETPVLLFLRRADWEISESMKARFAEECDRLTRARHPHLVRVLGGGVHQGRLGLFTEDVSGVSLQERLVVSGPPAPDTTLAIAEDLVGAIRSLHGVGLFGRDLGPGRILEAPEGGVVLLDLGSVLELAAGRDLPDAGTRPDPDMEAMVRLLISLRGRPSGSPSSGDRTGLTQALARLYHAAPDSPEARRARVDLGVALGARLAS